MTMLISGGFSHKKMKKSVEGEGEIRVFFSGGERYRLMGAQIRYRRKHKGKEVQCVVSGFQSSEMNCSGCKRHEGTGMYRYTGTPLFGSTRDAWWCAAGGAKGRRSAIGFTETSAICLQTDVCMVPVREKYY